MLGRSLEDYIEAILILGSQKGQVRSVDVAGYLNYSKPSVSHAVKRLQENGYVTMDDSHLLHLSDRGRKEALRLYERRCFFASQLIRSGVSPDIARQDACRIEHMISDESFEAMKQSWHPVYAGDSSCIDV